MASILVTGGTGFIGRALIPSLLTEHTVINLVRPPAKGDLAAPGGEIVEGSFLNPAHLHRLDDRPFDVVIHLAAVKAHCSEADGLAVNVNGSHELLRYALNRGCRRFVVASTIAVPGCWNPDWLPPTLPIPADQESCARDAYGMSKWLMEQEIRYFQRCTPDAGFVVLRLAHVHADGKWKPTPIAAGDLKYPWLQLADVMLSDTISAFRAGIEASHRPGVSIYNISATDVLTEQPVADALRTFFGARSDALGLSFFQKPGKAYHSVYDLSAAEDTLNWVPAVSVRKYAGLENS